MGFEEAGCRADSGHGVAQPAHPGTALEGVALALVHRDAAVRALADQSVRQLPWWSTPLRDNAVDAPRVPPHDEAADPAYALTALRDCEPRTVAGRF